MGLTEWGRAPLDELVIAVVANLEEVLTGLGEAITVVKALRPKVLRPHPKAGGRFSLAQSLRSIHRTDFDDRRFLLSLRCRQVYSPLEETLAALDSGVW